MAQFSVAAELKKLKEEKDKVGEGDQFIMSIQEIGNFQFQICIRGPENTPYRNYLYFLNFQFTNEYPNIPPQVTFMNKIYHPNVNIMGYIYCKILKNDWKRGNSISEVLTEIKKLLEKPDLDHIFNAEAAELYLKYMEQCKKQSPEKLKPAPDEYIKIVSKWCDNYAIYIND